MLAIPVSEGIKIIALKFTFLSLKWVAILALARLVKLKLGRSYCWLFIVSVLSCGIFWFFGEIFSPEFLTFFLGSMVVILLAKDNFECGTRLPVALFLATLCLLIKLTTIPIFIFVLLYLTICIVHKTIRSFTFCLCVLALLLAMTVAFSGVMTGESQANFVNWMLHNTKRNFSIKYLLEWIPYTDVTWDRIALSGGVGVLGIFSAIAVWLAAFQDKTNVFRLHSVGLIAILSGIIGLLFILPFQGYLDWYIQMSVFLLIFGFFYSINNVNKVRFWAVLVSVGIFSLSLPDTVRRVDIRWNVLRELEESSLSNQRFLKTLYQFEPQGMENRAMIKSCV